MQCGTLGGKLDAFRRAPHQLRIDGALQPAQALAQRGLAQAQGLGRPREVAVLCDHGEVFDVAQFHGDNRNSCPRQSRMIAVSCACRQHDHMKRTLIRIGACLAAAFGLVAGDPSWSQAYPVKPIRLIVAGPAGGGNDVITRPIAQKLSESLGQQVIVDNRPGAGTLLAGQATAGSAPDGYTVMMATISTLCISPHLVGKKPYDPVRDFAPVTLVATAGLMVAVHPSLPAKTTAELIALAKSRPGRLAYASNGAGSLSHL